MAKNTANNKHASDYLIKSSIINVFLLLTLCGLECHAQILKFDGKEFAEEEEDKAKDMVYDEAESSIKSMKDYVRLVASLNTLEYFQTSNKNTLSIASKTRKIVNKQPIYNIAVRVDRQQKNILPSSASPNSYSHKETNTLIRDLLYREYALLLSKISGTSILSDNKQIQSITLPSIIDIKYGMGVEYNNQRESKKYNLAYSLSELQGITDFNLTQKYFFKPFLWNNQVFPDKSKEATYYCDEKAKLSEIDLLFMGFQQYYHQICSSLLDSVTVGTNKASIVLHDGKKTYTYTATPTSITLKVDNDRSEQIQETVGLLEKELQSDNPENFKEKRFIVVDDKEIILPRAKGGALIPHNGGVAGFTKSKMVDERIDYYVNCSIEHANMDRMSGIAPHILSFKGNTQAWYTRDKQHPQWYNRHLQVEIDLGTVEFKDYDFNHLKSSIKIKKAIRALCSFGGSYFDFNIVDCFPGFREPTLEGIHNNMIIYSLFYKLGESMNDFDRFGLLKIEKE